MEPAPGTWAGGVSEIAFEALRRQATATKKSRVRQLLVRTTLAVKKTITRPRAVCQDAESWA